MRLALCVKRDIFGLIAARAFAGALAPHAPEMRVFCSVKTRPAENTEPLPRLLKELERDFPLDTLLPAIASEWRSAPEALRVERWEPLLDMKPDGGAGCLLAWQPDLVVSIRFSLIFPQRVIDAVPLGIVNVHPGPLPAYRGLFTPFWQAHGGEPVLTSTLHVVAEKIDTGPVIAEHHVPRTAGRSLMWHVAELYRGGAVLAARTAAQAMLGNAPRGMPQAEGGRYWRMPGAEDVAAFARGTMPVILAADYLDLLREALVPPPATGLDQRLGTAA